VHVLILVMHEVIFNAVHLYRYRDISRYYKLSSIHEVVGFTLCITYFDRSTISLKIQRFLRTTRCVGAAHHYSR